MSEANPSSIPLTTSRKPGPGKIVTGIPEEKLPKYEKDSKENAMKPEIDRNSPILSFFNETIPPVIRKAKV